MSYRFLLGENIEKGFRRIALEQLGRAATKLERDGDDPKAIHEVRKHLKRVRALLRLVRSGLGDEKFRAENHRLRDIGRLLAGERERHVMLQTLLALETRDGVDSRAIAVVRKHVESGNGDPGGPSAPEAVTEASRRLAQAARAMKRLRLRPDGFGVIATGLETGMRSLRRSHVAAYAAESSDEIFHEWRKAVQHHWRHMGPLNDAWPAYMAARAQQARELSQFIGDDHDLGVLATFAAAPDIEKRSARVVRKACLLRQAALRRHAQPLGERLIAEGAEGFARRVAIYWDTARRSEQTAPADIEDTGEAVEQVRSKPNGIARRETTPPAQPRRSDPAEPT